MSTVPYVISTAHPDDKRPFLEQEFGICQDKDIKEFFINKCSNFILEMTSKKNINNHDDIDKFFKNYFNEYFMYNKPWEANVFIDGKWTKIIPSYQDLFNKIHKIKI